MVEDASAPKIVENVRAMPSPPETPGSGKMDTPSEATPLAQCNLSRKRKVDQEECFPTDFISKGLDWITYFCYNYCWSTESLNTSYHKFIFIKSNLSQTLIKDYLNYVVLPLTPGIWLILVKLPKSHTFCYTESDLTNLNFSQLSWWLGLFHRIFCNTKTNTNNK